MIKNNGGESLVGIIIGVFILSIILLGIANLLINSKTMVNDYENTKTISILKQNTDLILNKLDIFNINENEVFYLYRDKISKKYLVFTGSTNEEYKYIDNNGFKIDDVNTFEGIMYLREITLLKNIDLDGNNYPIFEVNIKKIIQN